MSILHFKIDKFTMQHFWTFLPQKNLYVQKYIEICDIAVMPLTPWCGCEASDCLLRYQLAYSIKHKGDSEQVCARLN